MNSSEFFASPLWGNKLFVDNGICLVYKNWILSGFCYENGNFITEELVLNQLTSKRNWMVECLILKRIMLKIVNKYHFNTELSNFVNINNSCKHFIFNGNKNINIINIKSKVFYKILIDQKSTPHYMRKRWEHVFKLKLCNFNWRNIYQRKIKKQIST